MLSVLKNGRFARLWLGQSISFLGDWLDVLALLSLLAFRWHASPFELSLFGLFMALPWAIIGPFAGVFADRWNRKGTMIAADLLRAAIVLGYLAADSVLQVYVLLALKGAVSTFFSPARLATIKQIVPEERLLSANSLSQLSLQFTKIIGPAVGGVLVAAFGESFCFWADSLSFLASAAMIATVSLPTRRAKPLEPGAAAPGVAVATDIAAPRTPTSWAAFVGDFRAGLRHIIGSPPLLWTVLLTAAIAFSIGLLDGVFVAFIRETLGASPQVMGGLMAAVGIGATVSVVWAGQYGRRFSREGLCITGTLGMGVGIVLVSAVTYTALLTPGLIIGFALLAGLGVGLASVALPTLLQTHTPDEKMGRVSAATDSLATGVQLVSFPSSGALAGAIGAASVLLCGGLALTLAGLAGWGTMPARGKGRAETGTATAGD